jgi:acetyl-CoA carboxylase biotin carboxylase subunit
VEAAGLAWIGPSGNAIRLMGDKVAARCAAHAVAVPTVRAATAM